MTLLKNLTVPKSGSGYKLMQTMEQAFPDVDPGVQPVGSRVLVQIKSAAAKTESGLLLTTDTVETEHDNTQTAKLIAVGPGAFRNRETLELWPEGEWAKPGDFVRVPKYGKEQWRRPGPDGSVAFAMFEDLQIVGIVTINPLDTQAFL